MPKVLVFESESDFAAELTKGLAAHECQVTVVDDAAAGLQSAGSEKPDLILLAIELPRMNGFSVCNKLRRDPKLKKVPLLIMSRDSTQETFEQHMRLRTRADEYVHKPVTFADLLPKISALLDLPGAPNGGARKAAAADDEIEIDDEIELDDSVEADDAVDAGDIIVDGVDSVRDSAPSSNVDADVDQFTEDAFDSLLDDEGPTKSHSGERLGDLKLDDEDSLDAAPHTESSPVSKRGSIPPSGELIELRESLKEAKEQKEEAESQARELRKDRDRLQTELDEANVRARQASSSAGGSAREFLDLREQVNKKEKEVLDLRDELTNKQKELLASKDASLGFEREKADLSDQAVELEKQIQALTRAKDAALADKEQAGKRAEDHKRKAEKLATELRTERDNAATAAQEREESEARSAKAAEEKLEAALSEAKSAAGRALEAALTAASSEAANQRQETERKAREELDAAKATHRSNLEEVESLNRQLAEELRTTKESLDKVQGNVSLDVASLEKAKDALAASLAAIEEIEARRSA